MPHSHSKFLATLLVVGLATAPTSAMAWGAQGHQYVGALAEKLLNPNARGRVQGLLGAQFDLAHAAVWPDCIRSVDGSPGSTFSYHADQFTPAACGVFGNSSAERDRMTDYASRNWTNCEYSGRRLKCNLSYHFADVNPQNRSTYQLGFFGTGSNDVVQAIKAAIIVLKCPDRQVCDAPFPFNIKDKREALLLIAHFVGDVHQPLHVGSIYLGSDNRAGGDDGASIVGGNSLLLSPGEKSDNLHHAWDTILASLKTEPSAAAISSGCQISPLPNPALQKPEDWASESVVEAMADYRGMTFARDAQLSNYWDITFERSRADYVKAMRTVQARRLVQAGARLAATLNAIWPSTARAQACGGSNAMRHRAR